MALLLVGCVSAPAAKKPQVSECFKVRRLLRSDATHYWADWSSACPFTIDAVYVMVGFQDHGHNDMGNGVWPMYFVRPGAHGVNRFSAPVAGFDTVRVHRITTDSTDALAHDQAEVERVEEQTVPPGTVGDTEIGRVIPFPFNR